METSAEVGVEGLFQLLRLSWEVPTIPGSPRTEGFPRAQDFRGRIGKGLGKPRWAAILEYTRWAGQGLRATEGSVGQRAEFQSGVWVGDPHLKYLGC